MYLGSREYPTLRLIPEYLSYRCMDTAANECDYIHIVVILLRDAMLEMQLLTDPITLTRHRGDDRGDARGL